MAFFDDKNWLLDHVKNSFITSDDTGMCEKIMLNNDFPVPKNDTSITGIGFFYGCNGEDDDDGITYNSPDIISDMDFQPRRRSNTAIKLEKIKKERQEASKIKRVPWRENPNHLSESELEELFGKIDWKKKNKNNENTSLLSRQIQAISDQPANPFNEYARFDGSAQVGIPVKNLRIFLTMLPEDERAYSMRISVVSGAKVEELIGLTLYKYSLENGLVHFKHSCDKYTLHIAEDNGEVDQDFPYLNPKESISKFGFDTYALVEKEQDASPESYSPVVFVCMPDGSMKKFMMDSMKVQLKGILEKAVKEWGRTSSISEYYLTKDCDTSMQLDLDSPLEEVSTFKFHLLIHEGQEATMPQGWGDIYRVTKVGRMGLRQEYRLGVSADKMEFEPVAISTRLLGRAAMAYSYDMEIIAACYMQEERPVGNKCLFRIVRMTGSGWKTKEYESELQSGREIVHKVNQLLQTKGSVVRKDYMEYKERKSVHIRKRSLTSPR